MMKKGVTIADTLLHCLSTSGWGREDFPSLFSVGIYADQRIGELLRELPKATNQHDAKVVGMPTSNTSSRT